MFLDRLFKFHMSSSAFVQADSSRTWDVVQRADRRIEWSGVCREVWDAPEVIDGTPDWRIGHKFGFKLSMAGREIPFNVTVSRFFPGRQIEWRSTKFGITAIRTISVTPDADGSRVTDTKRFSSRLYPLASGIRET